VPANAAAVSLNVTATDADGVGYVTLFPCTEQAPNASTVNQPGRSPVANNAVAMLSLSGSVCLFTSVGSELIVDVTGYFTPAGGAALASTELAVAGATAAYCTIPVGRRAAA
jgi:hypothetical protein